MGQWQDHVRFVAKTSLGQVVFGNDGLMYMTPSNGGGHAVKVAFQAEGAVIPLGVDEGGSVNNYLIGNDPDAWVTGVRQFNEVIYRDVWPGIDIRYYTVDGNLKYDLVMSATAEPSMVQFRVQGHEGLADVDGRLEISLPNGIAIHDRDLAAWYGDGETADVTFSIDGDTFGFDVDKEPDRTLTIDPLVIPVCTFLGGTYNDMVGDMVMDDEDNIIVAGTTVSTDFPITPGVFSEEYKADDLVVTKMDRNLTKVIWSTYIGGMGEDTVASIDVDDEGNVHVVGDTSSDDFPVTPGALQSNIGGAYRPDMYVLKLSSDGSSLVYSTYMGGIMTEEAGSVKVHDGLAYVAGMTESSDFPFGNVTGGYYSGAPFVMVFSEDGSRLETLMTWDVTRMVRPDSMHVDEDGIVTIAGMTTSEDIPTTPGVYMEEGSTNPRSYVIQCDPWTNRTIMATYFAIGWAYVSEVDLDAEGNIYVAGLSYSTNLGVEITPGAWCTTVEDQRSLFLSKLNANGTQLIYSTWVGGNSYDFPGDLAVTDDGIAVFVGWCWDATGFETTENAHDQINEGVYEGFVLALSEDGSTAVMATLLGGRFGDLPTAVEITPEETLMVAGHTESKGFPVTKGAYQEELAGNRDMFVMEMAVLHPPTAPQNLTATGGEGNITLQWDPPLDVMGYPVENYTVHRMVEDGQMEEIHVGDSTTSFIDETVEYGVYYTYRVVAFNGQGMGPKSRKATARSVTVPDPPTNLTGKVSEDHILLSWRTPVFTGGLALEEYNLYRTVEGDEEELLARVYPHLGSFADTDVEDRTTYTYRLSATNEYGESRVNPTITLRMTGTPTPPLYLNHTYGDQYIALNWSEPEDDYDLPVARYYVYRSIGKGPDQLVGVVNSPDLVFTDRTVDVGVYYYYHVVAENAKGPSVPSNTVRAMTMVAPDPPQNVVATARELFVRITWDPSEFDGASPILSYRIYLGESLDDSILLGDVYVMNVDGPRLVYLHEVAYDGTIRSYFVTALNIEGESVPSHVANTLMYEIPSSPRSLEADWGDGKVTLSWSFPVEDGGTPVLRYHLYREGPGVSVVDLGTLPASTLRYVDDTVANGIEYDYWVTAVNLAGESDPSAEVRVMPAGPPSAPESVFAEGMNGSVTLSWEAPDWNGGLPIDGYRVYGISESTQTELLADLSATDREYAQDSLVNGMVYLYAVQAYSDAGDSDLSPVVEGRPVGAPSSPQALIAVWMDGMVYVTWSSPVDDGGAFIGGYKLYREDWNGTDWTDVPALAMMYSDEDVEHNGTYTYRVYAYNDVGRSPAVNITITVPPKEASSDDDPLVLWPWLILAASVAILLMALATRARPRPPVYGIEEGEEDEESGAVEMEKDEDEIVEG
jgi:fibronectin type 3 domain-containing protein